MKTLEIEIDNEVLFKLMLTAHEKDITLNELINNILSDYIKKYEGVHNDNEGEKIKKGSNSTE
jgi:hypothetical protein